MPNEGDWVDAGIATVNLVTVVCSIAVEHVAHCTISAGIIEFYTHLFIFISTQKVEITTRIELF
jgi:hypothetical protein